MATFAELCNDVYTITNRPDLVAETKLAVKAATLKMHQSDYYYQDLYESGISFTDPLTTQQVDILNLFPRYRALKYFRFYDGSGTGLARDFFQILTPNELIDSYGVDKVNVVYVAGSILQVKSREVISLALLGIYQNPILDETTFNSWIAAQFPYAIIFDAARLVFKQIGQDEQSAAFEKLVGEQVAELKISNIQAQGY
jgi:hypothetical protein